MRQEWRHLGSTRDTIPTIQVSSKTFQQKWKRIVQISCTQQQTWFYVELFLAVGLDASKSQAEKAHWRKDGKGHAKGRILGLHRKNRTVSKV